MSNVNLKFDALLFDMDGTLVQNTVLMPLAFQKGFAAHGMHIETDPWRASGCTDWEVMDLFLSDFPELSPEQREDLKEKIAVDVKAAIFDLLQQQGLEALPGAPELIKKLVSLGIYPGLLTGNMEDIVAPKLKAAGMDRENFRYGGFGDHCPKRVDAARKALASVEAFFGHPMDPGRVLIIGDTPKDIACARQVGASVLAVSTGRYNDEQLLEHDPDFILKDLSDPEAFLEIIGYSNNRGSGDNSGS